MRSVSPPFLCAPVPVPELCASCAHSVHVSRDRVPSCVRACVRARPCACVRARELGFEQTSGISTKKHGTVRVRAPKRMSSRSVRE